MYKFIEKIEKNSEIIVFLGILMGLIYPRPVQELDFLILPAMFIVILLACLKINFNDFKNDFKSYKFLTTLTLVRSIFLPLITYIILREIFPQYEIGILLTTFCPVAVASAAITGIFRGKISQSIIITIFSSIIATIVIPLSLMFFHNTNIAINIFSISKTIFIALVLPMFIAYLMQKNTAKFIETTKNYYSKINIFILSFFMWIIISGASETILQNKLESLKIIIIHFFIIAIYLLTAIYISRNNSNQEKISSAISYIFTNNALVIGLSALYFDPLTTYFLIISEIPWGLSIPIWKKLQPVLIKEPLKETNVITAE